MADQPANVSGSGVIDIQHSTFRRSGGFNIISNDRVSIVFSRNIYYEDNLVSVDANEPDARPFFKEAGSSTASKFMQGNRLFRSWVDLGSPNWTFGAAASCTTGCDADGNIMIGPRVGLTLSGSGSYASYNYSHITLDVTPDWPWWSQVSNIGKVSAGSVVANNVIRSGHWVAQAIDGELRNNVLLELHPHEFVRIGSSGKIASLETSLSRLATPSTQMTRGRPRIERRPSAKLPVGRRGRPGQTQSCPARGC
jgi:hypothetical protein